MVPFDFKPSIVGLNNQQKLRITAPNDIRSKLWSALFQLRDVIHRTEGTQTQLVVEPYPGYTMRTVYVNTCVYLYSIISDLSLEEFWALSPRQHLKALGEAMVLPSATEQVPGGIDGEIRPIPVFAPITVDELKAPLAMRIAGLAQSHISYLYDKFKGERIVSEIVDWQRSALNATRRLEFLDPTQTFITADVWSSRIAECKKQMEVMADVYDVAISLNAQVLDLRADGLNTKEMFDKTALELENGQRSLKNVLSKFLEAKKQLQKIPNEIRTIRKSFSDRAAHDALMVIKSITPVEKA